MDTGSPWSVDRLTAQASRRIMYQRAQHWSLCRPFGKASTMGKAAEVVKASTEYYNSRDFDRWIACFAVDGTVVDLSQGATATGHGEIMTYGQSWIDALSDAAYADVRITEAGDTVMMQFNGEGINDGPFGTFPPTGKPVSFPFMNVITVNSSGKISRLEQLYDRLDVLTQLGHMSAS
jgi:predicted ester cyclase